MTLLHQLWNRVVCVWDFDTLTPGGLFRDFGPHELHATLGALGFAAPTRNLDGSYTFTGAGCNAALLGAALTRFYTVAPTQEMTVLAVYAPTTVAVGTYAMFSCENVAGNRGFEVGPTPSSSSLWVTAFDPAARTRQYTYGSLGYLNRKASVGAAVQAATTGRGYVDETTATVASVGAIGTISYDVAQTPCIGIRAGVGASLLARMYYLAILNVAVSDPDLLELNRLCRTGGKPWVWR